MIPLDQLQQALGIKAWLQDAKAAISCGKYAIRIGCRVIHGTGNNGAKVAIGPKPENGLDYGRDLRR